MAKYTTLTALFTAIANSLRGKTGSTGAIVADDFPSVIDSLSTGGITPTGTKSITTNGTHDVTSFASAQVDVPVPSGYVKPSGTKSITANGTHDVTSYASAEVNVPAPEPISVVRTKTFSSDVVGSGSLVSILSGDEFVKKHYADAGFSVTLVMPTPIASEQYALHFITHHNRNLSSSNVVRYGYFVVSNSASATGAGNITAKVSGSGYGVSFRADSSGNLKLYLAATRNLKAGTYLIILTCTT